MFSYILNLQVRKLCGKLSENVHKFYDGGPWCRDQSHDAINTNEINLFGLAPAEDECKMKKKFVIIPSRHWIRTITYYSLPEHITRYKNILIIYICNFWFVK